MSNDDFEPAMHPHTQPILPIRSHALEYSPRTNASTGSLCYPCVVVPHAPSSPSCFLPRANACLSVRLRDMCPPDICRYRRTACDETRFFRPSASLPPASVCGAHDVTRYLACLQSTHRSEVRRRRFYASRMCHRGCAFVLNETEVQTRALRFLYMR